MSEKSKESSGEPTSEIRIKRLNTDKTRKDIQSDTGYHVCFELTGNPPSEWRSIFAREWKGLHPSQEVSIDGIFLVAHCQLHEVAPILLPALKKAVAETNQAFRRFAQKEATTLEHREEAWKQERNEVEAMAKLLRFD